MPIFETRFLERKTQKHQYKSNKARAIAASIELTVTVTETSRDAINTKKVSTATADIIK